MAGSMVVGWEGSMAAWMVAGWEGLLADLTVGCLVEPEES